MNLLVLFILIPLCVRGQEQGYSSRELHRYFSRQHPKPFKAIPEARILKYRNEFFQISECTSFAPWTDSLYLTPYQDSIFQQTMRAFEQEDESLLPKPSYIGSIERSQVLCYDRNGAMEALLYESTEYENIFFSEQGIWVGLSRDSGKSWNYFYTGIVQRQPLAVKWYSGAKLIASDSVLQVECALLQQTTPFTHPGPGAEYRLVQDGLLLNIDLNVGQKDSDGDGLTDIIERKFFTDPLDSDTDGDGLNDSKDLNPRYAERSTERGQVYSFVGTNDYFMYDLNGFLLPELETEASMFADAHTETVLFVTDDPDLLRIRPISTRYIILSEKEYKKKAGPYVDKLNRMLITPMFPVDGEKDAWILIRAYNTGTDKFLVRKTSKGWKIWLLSTAIS